MLKHLYATVVTTKTVKGATIESAGRTACIWLVKGKVMIMKPACLTWVAMNSISSLIPWMVKMVCGLADSLGSKT